MYNKGLVSSYYDAFNKYHKNNGQHTKRKSHFPVSADKIIMKPEELAIKPIQVTCSIDILKYLIEAW
jgi:hypothetical protein